MPTYELPTKDDTKEAAVSAFLGVDFSSDLSNVSPQRSPDCLNMTFSKYGAPVKRNGIRRIARCPEVGNINGMFKLAQEDKDVHFIHCGDKLYKWDAYADPARVFDWYDIDYAEFTFNVDPTTPEVRQDMVEIHTGLNDERSMAWQFGNYLYYKDSSHFLRISSAGVVVTVTSVAYVPTVRIGSSPAGSGGQIYESFNMLSYKAKETFLADGTTKDYKLVVNRIYGVDQVRTRDTDGEWNVMATTEYTYDGDTATVSFTTAPAAPTAIGEDNIEITYHWEDDLSADGQKVLDCSFGVKWSVNNGHSLVLSGNPAHRNEDYTSESGDPTYFPDSYYSVVGTEDSAIVGYCMFGGQLLVFKSDDLEYAVTYIRSVNVTDNYDVYFTTHEAVVGLSTISQFTTENFMGDSLFLSAKGVFSAAQSTVNANHYTTARSTYINRKLWKNDLRGAMLTAVSQRLYLIVGGVVYVADKYNPAKSEMSSHEYEWLYWETGLNAVSAVSFDDELLIGADDGCVYCYRDNTAAQIGADRPGQEISPKEYVDFDGKPIHAYWTTSYMFMDTFSRYKSIKRMYLMVVPFSRTGVDIYSKRDGGWTHDHHEDIRLFGFWDMDFSDFSFNTDADSYVVPVRMRIRRVVLAQFRFENKAYGEPFGLIGSRIAYKINGYAR